jgi:hypothetical protein
MLNKIFLFIGAAIPLFWGIAHLFPTNSIVKGFGDISPDNKKIITMEWINEGATLIFIGIVVGAVTYVDYYNAISNLIYTISFFFLNILSVISFMTGFKINYIPFKLCPIIFTGASIMILLGNIL